MTDDTIEMAPAEATTASDSADASLVEVVATLRPGDDLPEGSYELRQDRCVVEVTARVLGRPVLYGRVEAVGGTLTVGELSTLELSLGSMRTGVPFTRRFLAAGLTSEPLALRARGVHVAEDTVVLTASGPLPSRWLRLELAAEFVR
jgi:hypothetical protein